MGLLGTSFPSASLPPSIASLVSPLHVLEFYCPSYNNAFLQH
jgi:hypothetical protein